MSNYATVEDVEKGFRELSESEESKCEALLEEAAVIIDAYNVNASAEAKKVVSCRMIRRAIGSGEVDTVPIGASQGTMAALGYSQSWTMGQAGSTGELYLSKTEKDILSPGSKIACKSPLEFN